MLALIVIDCAEHSILQTLITEGEMPALSSLAKRGLTVPLSSDGHALDGSVFQTFLTGVNPGKHGIHKYRQLVPGTYDYQLSKAADSPVPQIWNVLSERGRRCLVFDVPKAFPTPDFNGKLVASWGAYSPAASPGSVPDRLFADVERKFGSHPMRIQKALPLTPREYKQAEQTLVGATRLRTDVCRWLLKDANWDFFATTFSESHVAAHQFWQLRDPQHPLYDLESARQCGSAVENVYRAVDENLARLLEALPEDAHLVVMTQQGVEHNYTGSRLLPKWLAMREGRKPRRNLLVGLDEVFGSRWRNLFRRSIPESLANRLVRRKFPANGKIFMLPGSEYGALLRVNLRGREPAGVVEPEAYHETLKLLVDDLQALRNPATGEPAGAEVQLTHQMYNGPRLDELPDAIVCWRNDQPITALECPRHGLLTEGISFTDITHSMHTSQGMAVMAGPTIRHGKISARHDIRDMTATLYDLAHTDPPADLEGTSLLAGHEVPCEMANSGLSEMA